MVLCVYSQMRSVSSSSLALTEICSFCWHSHLWAILPHYLQAGPTESLLIESLEGDELSKIIRQPNDCDLPRTFLLSHFQSPCSLTS